MSLRRELPLTLDRKARIPERGMGMTSGRPAGCCETDMQSA
jgi:hypothetical protein